MVRSLSRLAFAAVISAGLILCLTGAYLNGPQPGNCQLNGTAAGSNFYMPAGGSTLILEFEPDDGGAVSVARVSLYSCSAVDVPTSCDPLLLDTNYDGVPDSNILTGAGGARGTGPIRIAGYLRWEVSTPPSGSEVGNAVLRTCSIRV